MKATVITEHGGPEVLQIRELPDPVRADGEVLIRIKASGVNHAETHMRKGEWPEATPVSGIEAVSTVAHDPAGALADGTSVATLMGGLGRTRNGSYAEYVAAPAANVAAIETTLSWTDLAAIPESYATAWSTLHANLELEPRHTLLVRGATSALGQAAVNIASDLGATVIATTRRADRAELLRSFGAEEVVIENGHIADAVSDLVPGGADRVLDLVGNTVLRDSLQAVRAAAASARQGSSEASDRSTSSCRCSTCRAACSSASSEASSSAQTRSAVGDPACTDRPEGRVRRLQRQATRASSRSRKSPTPTA